MTEEQKEIREVKRECLKRFLFIAAASFTGTLLALFLTGVLLRPVFSNPQCCPHKMKCPPAAHMVPDFNRRGDHHPPRAGADNFRPDAPRFAGEHQMGDAPQSIQELPKSPAGK